MIQFRWDEFVFRRILGVSLRRHASGYPHESLQLPWWFLRQTPGLVLAHSSHIFASMLRHSCIKGAHTYYYDDKSFNSIWGSQMLVQKHGMISTWVCCHYAKSPEPQKWIMQSFTQFEGLTPFFVYIPWYTLSMPASCLSMVTRWVPTQSLPPPLSLSNWTIGQADGHLAWTLRTGMNDSE